jgi:hypothetical protein
MIWAVIGSSILILLVSTALLFMIESDQEYKLLSYIKFSKYDYNKEAKKAKVVDIATFLLFIIWFFYILYMIAY